MHNAKGSVQEHRRRTEQKRGCVCVHARERNHYQLLAGRRRVQNAGSWNANEEKQRQNEKEDKEEDGQEEEKKEKAHMKKKREKRPTLTEGVEESLIVILELEQE